MEKYIEKRRNARCSFLGEKIWFDLQSLLNKLEMHMNAVAKLRGKIMGATVTAQTPHAYLGNPLSIYDMLNNLVLFSLYHLDDACIFFNIHGARLEANKYRLVISAITVGTGISDDEIKIVFQPASKTGGQGNSSLYIAKQLAVLLGGDLTIENTSGWGTRYNLDIVLESAFEAFPSYNEKTALSSSAEGNTFNR